MIEVVAFAGPLADAGEHGVTAVGLGDVVDQLLNQHGLAHAGAAEQADLAALGVGRQQVDDLDAGDENLGFRGLISELGAGARIGAPPLDGMGPASSTGSPITFMMRPRVAGPTGIMIGPNRSRSPSWPRTRPSVEVHGDAAHDQFADVLGNFEHQFFALVLHGPSAFRIAGRSPSNFTSTTAPVTWVMRPVWLAGVAIKLSPSNSYL